MKRYFLLSFAIGLWVSIASSQELSSFEKRMYEIYKSSYKKEISDEEWNQYIGNLSQRSYIISEGDTLWDLSTIFFGDGNFWPKIWSFNETLTNPHLLRIGGTINFFTGSLDEAPGVTIENDEDFFEGAENEVSDPGVPKGFKVVTVDEEEGGGSAMVRDDSKASQTQSRAMERSYRRRLYPGAPSIPPSEQALRPVLLKIPSAFEDSDSYDASKYDEKGISFDVRPPVRVNPLYVAHSFLYGGKARDYPRVGTLVESEDNVLLVGLNQKVYIRSEEKLQLGERLTVMGRDYHFDRNGIDGDVIRYMGSVEITEILKDKMFRGTIINSLSGVKGSPWISREQIPAFEDDYVGRPTAIKVRIIGGGHDNVSRIYGQSDVVYLGGGANQGLRVGDILGIYKRRDIRYSDAKVEKSPTPIAHIKVYRTEPELTSAFVISSTEIVVPGDETGPPTLVVPVSTQSEKNDLNSIETGLDFNTGEEVDGESGLSEELSDDNIQIQ